MSFYWLILGILSVWRVTHLLYGEDGPGDLFVRLRRLAGHSFFGALLDCFYCLSLWVAVPFALLLSRWWVERGLLVLSLSAGAIVIERLTARERPVPVAQFIEDQEVGDVVLPGQTHSISPERSDSYAERRRAIGDDPAARDAVGVRLL
jgi:hypothetical protein